MKNELPSRILYARLAVAANVRFSTQSPLVSAICLEQIHKKGCIDLGLVVQPSCVLFCRHHINGRMAVMRVPPLLEYAESKMEGVELRSS